MGVTKLFIENILSPILMAILVYKIPIANVWLRVFVGLSVLGILCLITTCFLTKEDAERGYPSILLIVLVIISLILSFFINIFKLFKKFCLAIKDKVMGRKNKEEKKG